MLNKSTEHDDYRSNFASGLDKGSAYAVYHKGELVVNLWGGWANELVELPWKENTVSRIFSSSKGIGAAVVAMLVDRYSI